MTDCTVTTNNNKNDKKNITILGLGIMGRAVAKVYAIAGYTVHAWNRGQINRDLTLQMKFTQSDNIIIYDDPTNAVQQSSIILMMVLADEMLATADIVIRSVNSQVWKHKTLVQFTSHEPFAIQAQEHVVTKVLHANIIGGAMMAVPSTVGTLEGVFLVSAKDPSIITKQHLSTLQVIGTVIVLNGNDIGLASLLDIGLLQTLQFGLAGNELSCFNLSTVWCK